MLICDGRPSLSLVYAKDKADLCKNNNAGNGMVEVKVPRAHVESQLLEGNG